MPALRHVHENAHRIICMSHLNQMGQAFVMYTMENKEWLPYSAVLHTGDYPSNLMIARRGGTNGNWDGLGLLYSQGFCPSPECFYCPSHHGNHDYEQYADRWQKPVPGQSIFANYHYAGDIEWANKGKRRTLDDGPNFALASDGLRTVGDFNHFDGMNILRGDGSVYWRDDAQDIIKTLPLNDTNPPAEEYTLLWEQLLDHH